MNSLQWPGPYLPHIKRLLAEIPAVAKLFDTLNTPYKIRNYGHKPDENVTGDSATIYGGFLRWIVGEVSRGRAPNMQRFLESGSDIDIAVNDYQGCGNKLHQYFLDLVCDGAVIEYAGMQYGESGITKVSIPLKAKSRLIYGNYMVWIPIKEVPIGEVIVQREAKREPSRPVREGVSFADILTGKAATSVTVSAAVSKSTSAVSTAVKKYRCWIKLDISYGRYPVTNDFSVNALTWPKILDAGVAAIYLKDIIDRRIYPIRNYPPDIKLQYRLIKLHRRGYKFGVGDSSDAIMLKEYMQADSGRVRKRRQVNTQELIGCAFTGDTSAPSMKPHPYAILTTAHVLTKITAEYISGLPEYRELMRGYGINVSEQGVESRMNLITASDLTDDSTDDEFVRAMNAYLAPTSVIVTSEAKRAFKVAQISSKAGKYVCIELEIPVGVRAKEGFCAPVYERALITGIYAYPRVRINDLVRSQKLTIYSNHNPDFHYATAGDIKYEVVAEKCGKIEPITTESKHGIYTYDTMIEAWNHVSREDIMILEE
jgi:hypothetical protein